MPNNEFNNVAGTTADPRVHQALLESIGEAFLETTGIKRLLEQGGEIDLRPILGDEPIGRDVMPESSPMSPETGATQAQPIQPAGRPSVPAGGLEGLIPQDTQLQGRASPQKFTELMGG